ncbi:unnamed protein product [Pleuronectes platessa]|uniref:Uncharacterized protein n=1 Tax=Pleuronectes platessa TaxID=8262 RepID=A0A9N7YQ96_PLEPL|nr:unnamed protein product [Pleuronectes platessa]
MEKESEGERREGRGTDGEYVTAMSFLITSKGTQAFEGASSTHWCSHARFEIYPPGTPGGGFLRGWPPSPSRCGLVIILEEHWGAGIPSRAILEYTPLTMITSPLRQCFPTDPKTQIHSTAPQPQSHAGNQQSITEEPRLLTF